MVKTKKKSTTINNKKPTRQGSAKPRLIEQYEHKDKNRTNNPPVGLVTPETDKDLGKKTYQYDPHLDPQLVWAGKAERLSFDVDTVSLHVHERIDPHSIIEAVRKKNGSNYEQMSLFTSLEENPPLREAVEFYKHRHNWSNRLIAGDSLLVMNSLIEKEGLAGQVQMIYIDPPYGIKYGSNFQPFVNKRDVKDGKDEDLCGKPETIKAFRDTWELGIHSYLTYLRDRLLLARELLHESGSCFVQISDENLHHVKKILDEVFETKNFVSLISFTTTSGFPSNTLSRAGDYVVWYARNIEKIKYSQLYNEKTNETSGYDRIELPNKIRRILTEEEKRESSKIPKGAKIYSSGALFSAGKTDGGSFDYKFVDKIYSPPNGHWKTNRAGMDNLAKAGRLESSGNTLRYIRYLNDFPAVPLNNLWKDTQTFIDK